MSGMNIFLEKNKQAYPFIRELRVCELADSWRNIEEFYFRLQSFDGRSYKYKINILSFSFSRSQ